MKRTTIYDDGTRAWTVFGRDPERGPHVIDTNQYLVTHKGRGALIDPGGIEVFPAFVGALSAVIDPADVDVLFASHQDPDIISSLALWLDLKPELQCMASWTWSSFIPHFGGGRPVLSVPDDGGTIPLGGSRDLRIVPSHYCHSSGHFTIYDPRAKILFSSDIGAALLPEEGLPFEVKDFNHHVRFMEAFHKRWMPSNAAKNDWIRRVRKLDINLMCPQHGSIFRGDDVKRFLDWFEELEVGTAIQEKPAAK
jgi:flavorubredoxin